MGDRDISRVVAGGVSSRVAEGVVWGVGGVAEGVVEGVVWGVVVGGSARFAELVGRCCQGWRWWWSIADLGGGCCAGRFLVGCEKACCWDLAGLWRGSFAVIGFTHPQPNFAKIKSDCGKKLYHFMLFGVYAVIIFIIHTCHHKSQLHPKSGIM